ncbi:MAG: mechanosensitive ion channel [Mediterranea massiliensis]|nr:mechanosensitive ion channel [Mediterranea massiliensis]
MEILTLIDTCLEGLGISARWAEWLDQYIAFALILILAGVSRWLCRMLLLKGVTRLVKNSRATWDDILFSEEVLRRFSNLVAPFVLTNFIPLVFAKLASGLLVFIVHLCDIYLLITLLKLLNALMKALYAVYSQKEHLRNRPLKGLLQTGQVVLWFVGVILVIAILFNKQPLSLLAGLSASAAILMLVFKDSIMGVVSGVQLSANDMLKVGDWITMPKCGADGTVIEVTLNTVKVQNWDNTIVTIPPYLLVSDSFQNWRGMSESGGRRIKRSINIDMTSVSFCTPEMLEKYRKIQLLKDYIEQTEQVLTEYNAQNKIDNSVLVNGRRQTNLGVFRAYLTAYLKNMPRVNQGMTLMVRQLQPTDKGIPMELYFFSANTDWGATEDLQSDVFDHLLAIIPEFGLRVFQSPTGADLQDLASN